MIFKTISRNAKMRHKLIKKKIIIIDLLLHMYNTYCNIIQINKRCKNGKSIINVKYFTSQLFLNQYNEFLNYIKEKNMRYVICKLLECISRISR